MMIHHQYPGEPGTCCWCVVTYQLIFPLLKHHHLPVSVHVLFYLHITHPVVGTGKVHVKQCMTKTTRSFLLKSNEITDIYSTTIL